MKWPTVKLKSVTSKVGSGATPRGGEAVYKDVGVPLIRSMNVHFDGFRRDGLVYIDEDEASLLNHVEIQSNDVLFNITGASIGRVTTAPADMAGARVNQHVCILRPTDKLMPQFLSYYMGSPDQQVLVGNNQTGGTRQAVTKGMLLNWEIHLPPLAEQGRIVKLLNEADELRKLRAQSDRRTAALIPALFHEMFGDPAMNPQDFPISRLGELCETIPNYGTMVPARADEGEWLSLRVANIQDGLLDLTDQKFVDLPDEMLGRHTVKDGDLLLARAIGSKDHLGKCIVARPGNQKWAFDSHLMRVRLNRQRCEPVWLKTLLDTSGGRQLFLNNTRQSAVQFNINSKEFASIAVPLPPLSLQKEFAGRVSEIRAVQAEQATSRHRLEHLFQSLLHHVFQGEL